MKEFLEKIFDFIVSIFKKNEETVYCLPDNGDYGYNGHLSEEKNDGEEPSSNTTVANDVICIPTAPKSKLAVLLDNGHASSTPGKRSPCGTFREYEFNRDIVRKISRELDRLGIRNHILVPEEYEDIKLTERANRANRYCDMYGAGNCILISVHANAAGCGEWMNGRGWSIYTTKGNTKSDSYATIFYEEAEKILPMYGMTLRKDMKDGDPDYEEDFTVIYKAKCPAVLTENLFQDNKIDCEFLKSQTGRDVITLIHVNAIKRISELI